MTRNEKIIKLLEDNGFIENKKDIYYRTIEIKRNNYRNLIGIKITAYVCLDEEDMEDSYVEFNVECDIDTDLSDALEISKELPDVLSELNELEDEISNCVGD